MTPVSSTSSSIAAGKQVVRHMVAKGGSKPAKKRKGEKNDGSDSGGGSNVDTLEYCGGYF